MGCRMWGQSCLMCQEKTMPSILVAQSASFSTVVMGGGEEGRKGRGEILDLCFEHIFKQIFIRSFPNHWTSLDPQEFLFPCKMKAYISKHYSFQYMVGRPQNHL